MHSLQLKAQFSAALKDILHYWKTNAIDEVYGGFIGQIDAQEQKVRTAEKGSVLNARLLWTFSAAHQWNGDPENLALAIRSFNYIKDHFIDPEFGGVYWSLDYQGNPLNTKKQIYAIAFTIYGLSAYYKVNPAEEVLELAKKLYADIEKNSFDPHLGGYFEAFTQDWGEIADIRLSTKDKNEKKTMNTHLHILEAYTSLYSIWPDQQLKTQIIGLIKIFKDIMLTDQGHLNLFFNENWALKSRIVSYGHDIEAAWLLLEAAEAIGELELIEELKMLAVKIATAVTEGMAEDGGLNYELNLENGHLIEEKHWWVQAEALVGFFNAWQISADQFFLDQFHLVWNFTQKHLIDKQYGEWYWGVNADHTLMENEDKAGFWKCPYHNSRACLELLKRCP